MASEFWPFFTSSKLFYKTVFCFRLSSLDPVKGRHERRRKKEKKAGNEKKRQELVTTSGQTDRHSSQSGTATERQTGELRCRRLLLFQKKRRKKPAKAAGMYVCMVYGSHSLTFSAAQLLACGASQSASFLQWRISSLCARQNGLMRLCAGWLAGWLACLLVGWLAGRQA